MTDNLRNRIEAALNQSLKSQAKQNGFANEYQPYDDDGEPYGHTLIRVDAVLDPHALADAVIAALGIYEDEWGNRGVPVAPEWSATGRSNDEVQ